MALQRFEMFIDPEARAGLGAQAKATGQSIGALLRRAADDLLAKCLPSNYRRDVDAFLEELRRDDRMAAGVDALATALAAMDMQGEAEPAAAVMMDLLALLMRAPWPLDRRMRALDLLLAHDGHLKVPRKCLTGSRLPIAATSENL